MARRVCREIYSGAVLEKEFFFVSDRLLDLDRAEPARQRFKSADEREAHRAGIQRRAFIRRFNYHFSPSSFYTTNTLDNAHEVHTFEEARKIRDNYIERLRGINKDAKIICAMGRGKKTHRIHFHFIIDGLSREAILSKWNDGDVVHIENLRRNVYYNGIDYGQDYTGLANYLFDHWTPEQGGRRRCRETRNLVTPKSDIKENEKKYSVRKPPAIPKGYKLVEARQGDFGYLYFKAVLIPGARKKTGRRK